MNIFQAGKNWIAQKRFSVLDYVVFSAVLLAMVLLARLYFRINPDDVDWESFKVAHACTLQAEANEQHQSRWQCDDGEIYYRWRQQR